LNIYRDHETCIFSRLEKRPLFDEIVGYLDTQQQMMKYPDRTATRIKIAIIIQI